MQKFFKSYGFSLFLVASIIAGSCLGLILKDKAAALKPLGDVFVNLLFTCVVPLVFFSIASAIAHAGSGARLRKIFIWMLIIFTLTGIVASVVMILAVKVYPPTQGLDLTMVKPETTEAANVSNQIVRAFTVSDFFELLSKKNMLALIVFSILVGLAASQTGEKGHPFVQFLNAGSEIMGKVISYIMLYSPIGLGAYFAYLTGVFGQELMGSYLRVVVLYYPVAILYFAIAFSVCAALAGGRIGVEKFWQNILPAAFTAWGTGSSVATIPTNLAAAKRIGVPEDVRELVIPVGATFHMEGTCLSAIVKIAVLFGIFQMDFSGPGVFLMAIGVALLSGTVMSGIPGGGFLGELMIVTIYGFPPEALPIISMIGTLVDPPATMVNSIGDNVSSMMIARLMNGKQWIGGA